MILFGFQPNLTQTKILMQELCLIGMNPYNQEHKNTKAAKDQ